MLEYDKTNCSCLLSLMQTKYKQSQGIFQTKLPLTGGKVLAPNNIPVTIFRLFLFVFI